MRKNTRKIEATTKLRIQKLNDRKKVHNIKPFIKFKTNSIMIQSEFPSNIVQISHKNLNHLNHLKSKLNLILLYKIFT